jgi:hypothetical protein
MDAQTKWTLQGIVDEVVGVGKIARVFDDIRTPGGYMVSTRDPRGLTEGEISDINYLIAGLNLEVSHTADTYPVMTIWIKPSQRHTHYKTHQKQSRSVDRGTGSGAADIRRHDGKQRRNKKHPR